MNRGVFIVFDFENYIIYQHEAKVIFFISWAYRRKRGSAVGPPAGGYNLFVAPTLQLRRKRKGTQKGFSLSSLTQVMQKKYYI